MLPLYKILLMVLTIVSANFMCIITSALRRKVAKIQFNKHYPIQEQEIKQAAMAATEEARAAAIAAAASNSASAVELAAAAAAAVAKMKKVLLAYTV